MAHWIIEDHGFGGTTYTCSECGDVFSDIHRNIYDDSPCPSCGAEMNEDEAEFVDDTRERSDDTETLYPKIRLLTNDEAATVLENMAGIIARSQGRGSGKTLMIARQVEALLKGAHTLRTTPDKY